MKKCGCLTRRGEYKGQTCKLKLLLAVDRAAVPALVLLAPVLAVARAAVLAHVLLAPVLAVARAAVPDGVVLAEH